MIKSMTGYGKSECEINNKRIIVEMKSLNSKNLDIYTKLPNIYKEKDLDIRSFIGSRLVRGKLELIVHYEDIDESNVATINSEVVKMYLKQLQDIASEAGLKENDLLLQTAMRLPDTLKIEKKEADEEEWKILLECISTAYKELDEFRKQEGKSIKQDIQSRISNILKLIPKIEKLEPQRVERVKTRISENLSEIVPEKEIDQNRFEQELIYYIEKFDISEEKVRLKNHCNYFLGTMKEEGPVGKKLSFISQEIGREINTLGSKANDSEIQKVVVLMKDELEKIKEQILNTL